MRGIRHGIAACAVATVLALVWSGAAPAQTVNTDPTVTASRSPSGNVRVGVPINFSAVGEDADGDTLTYAWDFGDGETSTAQNPSHFYLTSGGKTVTVTVSDGKGGTGSATMNITIQSNRNPSIQSATASPSAGLAPLTVQFTGAARDFDGHTVSYSWDLDADGEFEITEQNATRTYSAPGTYSAVLRVTDPFGGASTRTVTVTVLSAANDPTKKFNVLIFSKTAGFRHSSIDEGITALKLLGEQNNFGVDAIEEASLFTDEFLARYVAVIWLSTTGDVLNDEQQAAFERYIRAGGGYVGIHSAADGEYTWPWYGQLVGGYFRNHPNGTPTATVEVEDRTHLSTAHLPERWTRVDEWYNYQSPVNPSINGGGTDYSTRNTTGIHVLLKMDESTYNESDGSDGVDDDHPISWCHRFDGGRAWYTGLGHTEASYLEPEFLQHVLGGIEVATGFVADDTCGIVERQGDAGGVVPATLALSLGSAAAFGPFVPAVERAYTASTSANVISTAGDALLSVADPSATATGRLVNGPYALAQPLEAMASSTGGVGAAFAPLRDDSSPLSLLTYDGPISNDAVTVAFRQSIGAAEGLRTGTYSKTLVFTLSTTSP
jgi:PKD repeat protein